MTVAATSKAFFSKAYFSYHANGSLYRCALGSAIIPLAGKLHLQGTHSHFRVHSLKKGVSENEAPGPVGAYTHTHNWMNLSGEASEYSLFAVGRATLSDDSSKAFAVCRAIDEEGVRTGSYARGSARGCPPKMAERTWTASMKSVSPALLPRGIQRVTAIEKQE